MSGPTFSAASRLVGATCSCQGFGRCPTDDEGRWEIVTRKPTGEGGEAPHVAFAVFARGLLDRVPTRLYFGDEEAANAADPLLARVYLPEETLLRVRVGDRVSVTAERFPDVKTTGEVQFVSPTVDPASRTFTVKVELDAKGFVKTIQFLE